VRLVRPPDSARSIATSPGGRLSLEEGSLAATRPEGRVREEVLPTDTSLVSSEIAPVRRASRRTQALAAVAATAALLLVGGGLALARRAPEPPRPGEVIARPSATVAATQSAPEPEAPRSAPPIAWSAATTQAAVGSPPPRASPLPAKHHAPRPSPEACNPPYTIDANGFKKYKRECASW
jgi:serine/threonine-protein kinase